MVITGSHTAQNTPLPQKSIFFQDGNQFFQLIEFLTVQILAHPNPIGLGLHSHT
jgi:hypothetical protein